MKKIASSVAEIAILVAIVACIVIVVSKIVSIAHINLGAKQAYAYEDITLADMPSVNSFIQEINPEPLVVYLTNTLDIDDEVLVRDKLDTWITTGHVDELNNYEQYAILNFLIKDANTLSASLNLKIPFITQVEDPTLLSKLVNILFKAKLVNNLSAEEEQIFKKFKLEFKAIILYPQSVLSN